MFLAAHSGIRYLVLLLGLVALAYAIFGLATRRPYDRTMYRLASAYAGMLHLQVVLGVAVLFAGTFYPALAGHILMMVFAAVVAQVVPSVMRRRQPAERSWLPHVVAIALSLGLIALGIRAIGRSLFGSGVA